KLFNEMRSNSIGSVLGCFLCACHLTCVQSETCETSSLLQFHPVDANGKYDTHGSSTFAQSIVGGPSISNVTGPAKIFRTKVQAFDISGLNMYDGAGALVAFDSHRLYRFQAADTASKEKSWIAVYGLVAMILIAVSPIAYYEGPQALLMVISYLSAVTLVKVFVKETINLGYPYPNTLTAMHMLAVCLVTLIFERPKMDEALKVLPISVLNGLSLLTNNTAFLYGGVAFVSMIAANVPFMTFSLELIKGKRSFNFASAFSVGMVCGGSICCIQGEVNASLAAFIWATISALLRSARGVWQHELVSLSLSPLRLVFWNGFWSGCITLVTMVASGECLEGLMILPTIGAEVQVALLNSILAAVCLNITQWYAMKALGALMSSIVGNLNLILVIALSIAWLHEQVTAWQYVGVLLLATGTFTNKMQGFCFSSQNGNTTPRTDNPRKTPDSEPKETSPATLASLGLKPRGENLSGGKTP
ncbi:unnamed protein product, partial [Durusdinium trenchii]